MPWLPKKDFWTFFGLFTAPSLSENHLYTTETLGKELGEEEKTLYKGFTYKNFIYTSVYWGKGQAKSRKLMLVANHTIIDWGPHVCCCLTAQMILTALSTQSY